MKAWFCSLSLFMFSFVILFYLYVCTTFGVYLVERHEYSCRLLPLGIHLAECSTNYPISFKFFRNLMNISQLYACMPVSITLLFSHLCRLPNITHCNACIYFCQFLSVVCALNACSVFLLFSSAVTPLNMIFVAVEAA